MTDLSIQRGRRGGAHLPYMDEEWYSVLRTEVQVTSMTAAAQRLGVSRGAISQIIHGTGKYGTGEAATRRFGERVERTFSRIECPYLTEHQDRPVSITGAECRVYAYRDAPVSNPTDLRHWRACRACEKRVQAPVKWHDQNPAAAPAQSRARADKPGVAAPIVNHVEECTHE